MLTAVPGTAIRTAERVSQRYQSIPGPFRRRSLVFSLVGTRLHELDRRCAPTQFIYRILQKRRDLARAGYRELPTLMRTHSSASIVTRLLSSRQMRLSVFSSKLATLD